MLSTKHREGAIKLLEKSLGISFPEKKRSVEAVVAESAGDEAGGRAGAGGLGSGGLRSSIDNGRTGGGGAADESLDSLPAALRGVAGELAEKDAKRAELIKHIEECEAQGYDMAAYREDMSLPPRADASESDYRESVGGKNADVQRIRMKNVDTCDHNCRYCARTSCPNRDRNL